MRRTIVIVTPFATGDVAHGGGQATRGLVAALAARHEVVLVHPADRGPADPALEARCAAVHAVTPGRSRRTEGRGARLARWAIGRTSWAADLDVPAVRAAVHAVVDDVGPDIVQVEMPVLGDALPEADRGARVVTVHDPASEHRAHPTRPGRVADLGAVLERAAGIREEGRALRRADAVAVFTAPDLESLRTTHRHLPPITAVVPMGWTTPAQALDAAGGSPPTVLFAGSFDHPPNVEAAVRLATRILPLVWPQVPSAVLEIVGPNPPEAVLALACERVLVRGRVADVAPHLASAAVVAAPVSEGGGVRIKVLEALAAGKATIATSLGAAGIPAPPTALAVADTDEQLAAAVQLLLSDPASRVAMAGAARRWAMENLSWDAMAEAYDDLYDEVLAARGAR